MDTYHLSIKDSKGNYQHYQVPKEVYIYVKQLENYIYSPEQSRLLELYADRFVKQL